MRYRIRDVELVVAAIIFLVSFTGLARGYGLDLTALGLMFVAIALMAPVRVEADAPH